MKRLLATMFIAALGTLAVPTASDAAVRCHPVVSIDKTLSISGGRCAIAQSLERYVSTHESLDGSFFALKRQWLGAENRAGTKRVFDSPGWPTIEVRLTSGLPQN